MAITVAYPNTVTQGASVTLTDWLNPNNVKADDSANATAFDSGVAIGNANSTETLTGSEFNLLEEDAGGLLGTGLKIPAGASIRGVRYVAEIGMFGGTPVMEYSGTGAVGVSTSFSGPTGGSNNNPAMVVRSVGFGSLSAGSNIAVGNSWAGHDLGTAQGRLDARASLADPGRTFGIAGTNSNAIATSDFAIDFMRIEVEWLVYRDRSGGGTAVGIAGQRARAVGDKPVRTRTPGGGRAPAAVGGRPSARIQRGISGVATEARCGGAQKPRVSKGSTGGHQEFLAAGTTQTIIHTQHAGAESGQAVGGGEARVFTYAVTGTVRNATTNLPVATARVDVYRTEDHQHMGRHSSTGSDGVYLVAVPFAANSDKTFWVRARLPGAPNTFGTTDEDLVLVERQVQGPP